MSSLQRLFLLAFILLTVGGDEQLTDSPPARGATSSSSSLERRRTSLAQLPLDKLLQVKRTLHPTGGQERGDPGEAKVEAEDGEAGDEDIPLALRSGSGGGEEWTSGGRKGARRPLRRGDWADDDKDHGGKDLTSIFQSTITILSFLAFGGYLLCLIVSAVRNSNNATATVTTVTPTLLTKGRRRRRKRSSPPPREPEAEEAMMLALQRIAEAYVNQSLLESELDEVDNS